MAATALHREHAGTGVRRSKHVHRPSGGAKTTRISDAKEKLPIKSYKPSKSSVAPAIKRGKVARAKHRLEPKLDRSADEAQRKRIGNSLDLPAFRAYHQQNPASATYWETEE
jgi:hypothetical protein